MNTYTLVAYFLGGLFEKWLSFINSLSVKYFVIAFYGYPPLLFLPIWAYIIYKTSFISYWI